MINYNIIPIKQVLIIQIKILNDNFYTAGPSFSNNDVKLLWLDFFTISFTVIISRVSAFIIQLKLRRFCRSTVFTSISRSLGMFHYKEDITI